MYRTMKKVPMTESTLVKKVDYKYTGGGYATGYYGFESEEEWSKWYENNGLDHSFRKIIGVVDVTQQAKDDRKSNTN